MSVEVSSQCNSHNRLNIPDYVYYLALLLIIVFFALIRIRLRDIPLERDEGEFAYGGQLLLQGIPPYQFAYTMKLPGTAAMYAAIMAALGETPAGIHLGLTVVNAVTVFLLFLLGKRLYGRLAAVVAAASYALLSTQVEGFAAHATHFVVLFALAATLSLLHALESDSVRLFFSAGLLFGLAFLMKQPGLFFLLFAGCYTIQQKWRFSRQGKRLAEELSALAAGGALPFAVVCLMLWRSGVFAGFWFWFFDYARQYSTMVTPSWALIAFANTFPVALSFLVAVVFIGLVSATFLLSPRARIHGFLAVSFLVFSVLAVLPGFYFRAHYFILMLPAVSLMIGMVVSCATELMRRSFRSFAMAAVSPLIFLGACFSLVIRQRDTFFQSTPMQVCRRIYGYSPFPEAVEIAKYIANHSPERSTIAILGSEPEIYFYSHRHSATGYIYTYPLLEPQKYAQRMQHEMMRQIEAARPEFVIYVNARDSWINIAGVHVAGNILDWMDAYVGEYYWMDGIADIGQVTQYRWGVQAAGYTPRSPDYILIFRRRSP